MVSPAPMPVAGTAFPAPAPQSPARSAPPPRNIAARLVRSRLGWTAANAVMCLWLASILLHFAAAAAFFIGLVACADGSPAVAAPSRVRLVTFVVFVLLSFVAIPLYIVLKVEYHIIEEKKAPGPKSIAAEFREVLCSPLSLGLLAASAFASLAVLGDLLMMSDPVIWKLKERVGFVINVVGGLGMSMVWCFIVLPALSLRMWRIRQQLMWQHGEGIHQFL
ncbi:unnamed protein product [Urochloa humidicola]